MGRHCITPVQSLILICFRNITSPDAFIVDLLINHPTDSWSMCQEYKRPFAFRYFGAPLGPLVPGGPGSLGLLGCCWSIPGTCLRGMFTSGGSSHCIHVVHELGGLCHYSFFSDVRGWVGVGGIQKHCRMLEAPPLFLETYHPGPLFFRTAPAPVSVPL